MRIQHNIPAMNSYRQFGVNNAGLSKNLEKLSSGYKINRAGDDAAGLAISEKMRAQITGLDVATKNAKDGISMVQTAEGALQEVHDMLNRMYSLAEQSANGTYSDDVDREQLQKEVVSLRTEIDRIGDSANFNGSKLFDGSKVQGQRQVSQIADTSVVKSVAILGGGDVDAKDHTDKTDQLSSLTVKITAGKIEISDVDIGGKTVSFKAVTTEGQTDTIKDLKTRGGSVLFKVDTSAITDADVKATFSGMKVLVNVAATSNTQAITTTATVGKGTGKTMQIGDTADSYNQMKVYINKLKSDDLGVGRIDISTEEGAAEAMGMIKNAINFVSDVRGGLGAIQNRLDHTINNLGVMKQNIQDAESTIRDTDVAEEMMKFTKNSIMNQASQAMLAQANQLPQGVLQLLG